VTSRALFALDRTHCAPGIHVDAEDFLTASLDPTYASLSGGGGGGYGSGKALVLGTKGFRRVSEREGLEGSLD
jgi:hypothetical protein